MNIWTAQLLLLCLLSLSKVGVAAKENEVVAVEERRLQEDMQQIDCAPEQTEFKTTVKVVVYGNPHKIRLDEQTLLEECFVQAYNAVAESTCDELSRSLFHAKIESVDEVPYARRHLPEVNTDPMEPSPLPSILIRHDKETKCFFITFRDSLGEEELFQRCVSVQKYDASLNMRPFVLKFVLRGRCRGCMGDTTPFGPGKTRRNLSTWLRGDRRTQECTCPAGGDEYPVEEHFIETLEHVTQDETLDNVVAILAMVPSY